MVKGDDLQNQGQRILADVTKSAEDAHRKISELDSKFNEECDKLITESTAILTELETKQTNLLANFTEAINEKKNEFDIVAAEKTSQITIGLDSIQKALKSLFENAIPTKETDSENV